MFRLAFILDKLDDQESGQTKKQSGAKRKSIPQMLIGDNSDGRGYSHGKGIHHAIEAHAGADLVFGKHIGHPGGHTDRTAGKAYAVNKPGNYNEAGF